MISLQTKDWPTPEGKSKAIIITTETNTIVISFSIAKAEALSAALLPGAANILIIGGKRVTEP